MIVVLCLSLGIDSFLSHCHLLSPLIPPALLWSELGEDSQTPWVTGDFAEHPEDLRYLTVRWLSHVVRAALHSS